MIYLFIISLLLFFSQFKNAIFPSIFEKLAQPTVQNCSEMKPCYKENRTVQEKNICGIWCIIIVRDVTLYSPANWAEKRGPVQCPLYPFLYG
jgi:hypothetical protein